MCERINWNVNSSFAVVSLFVAIADWMGPLLEMTRRRPFIIYYNSEKTNKLKLGGTEVFFVFVFLQRVKWTRARVSRKRWREDDENRAGTQKCAWRVFYPTHTHTYPHAHARINAHAMIVMRCGKTRRVQTQMSKVVCRPGCRCEDTRGKTITTKTSSPLAPHASHTVFH